MKKLSHIPIQTWRGWNPNDLFGGWNPNDLFGGWLSALSGFKTLIGTMGLILGTCLILPCLTSLVLPSIKSIIKTIIERKTAAHVMMLWIYKPLDQDDAL
jgi:hypothetical protein